MTTNDKSEMQIKVLRKEYISGEIWEALFAYNEQ